ncbi:hypothetical protein [Cellulomonas fimi]|uniref:Uncharacterized protein n=1 Tax=Cellulomonas fimi TaxID=1708 RepID=A0A7Y0QIM8_CELFI|nr:hypothetical protein [Cellulomonas fimi]NMR20477.1 hypothetical protein [Cellulomonas fimi]
MSTTTARPARPAAQSRQRPPWVRAMRTTLWTNALPGLWFWGIALVPVGVATFAIDRVGEVELSIVQFVRYGAMWFPFSLAIVIAAMLLPVHVAHGITRRDFSVGSLAAGVLAGAGHAFVLTVLLELERLLYEAKGWPHVAGLDQDLDLAAGFLPTLGMLVPTFVGGQISGLLVGIAYYRFGGLRGTVALLLTLAPIYLVASAFAVGLWDSGLDLAPAASAALVVVGLVGGATAYHLIARRVPIRAVRS